jgi:pimeloyl-ACP methyl ester carboxylesterase
VVARTRGAEDAGSEPLALARRGTGPTLVLLHALGSSRTVWDPVVPALAERFDVLTVDLPGSGGSGPVPPGTEPHPAFLAGTVAALLDELGIDRPHVVGNSLGGWVALDPAGPRPVASLTLFAPAGLWRPTLAAECRAGVRRDRGGARGDGLRRHPGCDGARPLHGRPAHRRAGDRRVRHARPHPAPAPVPPP